VSGCLTEQNACGSTSRWARAYVGEDASHGKPRVCVVGAKTLFFHCTGPSGDPFKVGPNAICCRSTHLFVARSPLSAGGRPWYGTLYRHPLLLLSIPSFGGSVSIVLRWLADYLVCFPSLVMRGVAKGDLWFEQVLVPSKDGFT